MKTEQTKDQERIRVLSELLNHQRSQALAQVREYRRDQEEEALPPPGDEMDAARSLADVETHASLIERVEERLKAIDFALGRLDLGRYGIYANCGEPIPVERLRSYRSQPIASIARKSATTDGEAENPGSTNRLYISGIRPKKW